MANIKTCKDCPRRDSCEEPCEWLEKQLSEIEGGTGYKEIPMTEVEIDYLYAYLDNKGFYKEDFIRLDEDIDEMLADLKIALKSLTPNQRYCIDAHFGYRGKSYRDIARELGITHQAVCCHIHDGLARLKAYLIQRKIVGALDGE